MRELILKYSLPDGMRYDDISSFETESYIGIWNHAQNEYLLFSNIDSELYAYSIPYQDCFEELDSVVYNTVDEHIIRVSKCGKCSITLCEE